MPDFMAKMQQKSITALQRSPRHLAGFGKSREEGDERKERGKEGKGKEKGREGGKREKEGKREGVWVGGFSLPYLLGS